MQRPLISEGYRALNRELHARASYGMSGRLYADAVKRLAKKLRTRDILDYGCGKRSLEAALGFAIANYDPCIPGLDTPPASADIVVCTDVLEHIEPEHLDAVLDDLKRLSKRCVFLSIATRPAKKYLPDGRNAHLIQQPLNWWVPKLAERFSIGRLEFEPGGFTVVGWTRRRTRPSRIELLWIRRYLIPKSLLAHSWRVQKAKIARRLRFV